MKPTRKKFSLVCISNRVHESGLRGQTIARCSYERMAPDHAWSVIAKKANNNVSVLMETLKVCAENGWNLRIGSDIFPLYTLVAESFDAYVERFPAAEGTALVAKIKCARDFIREHKIRCSMHPDHFVVIASRSPATVANSVRELEYHGMIMDLLGLERSHTNPINIHINTYRESLDAIATRVCQVYAALSDSVQSRLVLENEHNANSWSVGELHRHVYSQTRIPITYDSLHHRLNSKEMSPPDAYHMAKDTWRGTVPIFHFSDSDPAKANKRAHADFAHALHPELFDNQDELVIDVEFKAKDYAIKKIQDMYANHEYAPV